MLGIDPPEPFAASVRLEMSIAPAGIPGPIKVQSRRDQGDRRKLGFLAIGLIQFRRVDAGQQNDAVPAARRGETAKQGRKSA